MQSILMMYDIRTSLLTLQRRIFGITCLLVWLPLCGFFGYYIISHVAWWVGIIIGIILSIVLVLLGWTGIAFLFEKGGKPTIALAGLECNKEDGLRWINFKARPIIGNYVKDKGTHVIFTGEIQNFEFLSQQPLKAKSLEIKIFFFGRTSGAGSGAIEGGELVLKGIQVIVDDTLLIFRKNALQLLLGNNLKTYDNEKSVAAIGQMLTIVNPHVASNAHIKKEVLIYIQATGVLGDLTTIAVFGLVGAGIKGLLGGVFLEEQADQGGFEIKTIAAPNGFPSDLSDKFTSWENSLNLHDVVCGSDLPPGN